MYRRSSLRSATTVVKQEPCTTPAFKEWKNDSMCGLSFGPFSAELCCIPSSAKRSRNAIAEYSDPRSLCTVSRETIGVLVEELMQSWIGPIHPCHAGPQSRGLHQPFHASATDPTPLCLELTMDPGTSVETPVCSEDGCDTLRENPVLCRMRTLGPPSPGVITRR